MRQALLAALALQHGWGADEALAEHPLDRRGEVRGGVVAAAATARAAPAPARAARPAPLLPGAPPVGGAVTAAEALAAAATDLASLRAAIAGFEGLALRDTATNLVFADGNPAAPLMIIGEAPGAEEDREGKPFVGPSGRLLDRMLGSIGLERQGSDHSGDASGSFYITNIVTWRPPGNRNPTDSEVALSLPFIRRHIALVRPRVLLLLGAVAVRSLTEAREGITRVRGKWFEVPVEAGETAPALATLHPAYLLRNPGAKKDAWADLLALRLRLNQIRQH